MMTARPHIARVRDALSDVPSAHLVGGAVRDILLEVADEALDLDVVVEGDAIDVARSAAARLGGGVRVHARFNTATVLADDLTFDVAGARREVYPHPGALPDVDPARLEDDLARRDFTVNALAVALGGPQPGRLRSAPDALDDLRHRRLRALHDASFQDDPTRLLRLVRYAARLAFQIEPHTRELATRAIAAGALGTVSGGRIGAELRLLLPERTALDALDLGSALKLWRALHPKLSFDTALGRAAQSLLADDGRTDLLRLAVGCRGFERAELRRWLDRLEFSAGEREVIVVSALDARRVADRLRTARTPSQIAAVARGRPLELVALAGTDASEPARRWLGELRHVGLEISGDDLVRAGVPQGPAVGRGLQAALDRKLDGEIVDAQAELCAALEVLEG